MTLIYTIYLYQHLPPANTSIYYIVYISIYIYIYAISITTFSQIFPFCSHIFPKKTSMFPDFCPGFFPSVSGEQQISPSHLHQLPVPKLLLSSHCHHVAQVSPLGRPETMDSRNVGIARVMDIYIYIRIYKYIIYGCFQK